MMRKILIILFCFLSVIGYSQTVWNDFKDTFNFYKSRTDLSALTNVNIQGNLRTINNMVVPNTDTTIALREAGNIIRWFHSGVDTSLWYFNGYQWYKFAPITAGGGGTGSVTSVGLAAPTGLTVSGSPVTTSGTLTLSTTLNGIIYGNGANSLLPVTIGSGLSFVGGTLSATGGGTGNFFDSAYRINDSTTRYHQGDGTTMDVSLASWSWEKTLDVTNGSLLTQDHSVDMGSFNFSLRS